MACVQLMIQVPCVMMVGSRYEIVYHTSCTHVRQHSQLIAVAKVAPDPKDEVGDGDGWACAAATLKLVST